MLFGRLALFQSIGLVAMYNMAYGRDCKLQNAMVCNVGQVPPGEGCMPVNAVLAMAYESRLALFQSVGLVAMCNMAYEAIANCKMAPAMIPNVGQVPPGDGCVPVNAVLAMAYELRLALFQSIGLVAMCNMAYERRLLTAKCILQ